MKIKATLIVLLLSFAALARNADADMIWHDAYKSPMSDWGAYMYDQNVKRHLREGAAKSKTLAPAAPKAPTAPITATDFTRDPKGKDVLAASPQFIALNAADRQNMYDSLLLSTAVLAVVHQSGDKQASQNLARQSLQQIGMPAE